MIIIIIMELFSNLIKYGISPRNILDIGAEKGNWTKMVRRTFPSCRFTLIEPIAYKELSRYAGDPNITVINTIINDYNGDVGWYEKCNTGDSIMKELTHHFSDVIPNTRKCVTLDTLFNNNEVFEIIKIDVQGAELKVLEGGKKLIQNTEFIILEMPFLCQYNEGTPTFLEHIAKLDSLGFIPYDIVEFHRCGPGNVLLFQIDICFIKKGHNLISQLQTIITNMGV